MRQKSTCKVSVRRFTRAMIEHSCTCNRELDGDLSKIVDEAAKRVCLRQGIGMEIFDQQIEITTSRIANSQLCKTGALESGGQGVYFQPVEGSKNLFRAIVSIKDFQDMLSEFLTEKFGLEISVTVDDIKKMPEQFKMAA